MIMVGFVGTDAADAGVAAVLRQLADGTIGGVMLLARNVISPEQVQALNASLRQTGASLPPLIAVDQEGGAVQRLSHLNGHTSYPSAREIASDPDHAARAPRVFAAMARELRESGFNINFGPVVDLDTEPDNPIIGRLGRSYGRQPDQVTAFARAFAQAHRAAGILTTAKHFPGHGSSRVDSHHAFTDIAETWREEELAPFRTLAQGGDVDMIMVGHLYHPRFSDGGHLPASLSRKAMEIIRDEFGFDGVIVSDDMEMGALSREYPFEERIARAVNAGIDLLVFGNFAEPADDIGERVHAAILAAVRSGSIARGRIEEAHARIMRMKAQLPAEPVARR